MNGLASGFEHVVAPYLVITMTTSDIERPQVRHGASEEVLNAVDQLAADRERRSPSHLYLELLRHGLCNDRALSDLDLGVVTRRLIDGGWVLDASSGSLGR